MIWDIWIFGESRIVSDYLLDSRWYYIYDRVDIGKIEGIIVLVVSWGRRGERLGRNRKRYGSELIKKNIIKK